MFSNRQTTLGTSFNSILKLPQPSEGSAASTVLGAAPPSMADGGVWRVVGDDLTTASEVHSQVSSMHVILPQDSASQVGAPLQQGAPTNTLPPPPPAVGAGAARTPAKRPEEWCSVGPCSWCKLSVPPGDHGNLEQAYNNYLRNSQDVAANRTTPTEVLTMQMAGQRCMLAACALQVRAWEPSDDNKRLLTMLQSQQLVPMDPGSAPGTAGAEAFAAVASPGTPEAASGSAGGSKKKRSKAAHKWWEDEETAEWRQEPWVLHNPDVPRVIKVLGDGKAGWHTLPAAATKRILAFYDTGKLGDVILGVEGNEELHHFYNYKIEGGKWLSQQNPNHPSANPRQCQIQHGNSDPVEADWSTESWRS